jgi:hypothetical protein
VLITATIVVKGTRYYRAKLEFEKGELHEGAELRLVHEPNNPYDSNAVSVRLRKTGVKLGHVPRELAPKYSSLVNAGRIKNTTVSKVSKSEDHVYLVVRITYDQPEGELLERQNTVFWRSASSLPEEPGVYAIENLQTERLYVGSSKNVRDRVLDHLSDLSLGSHPNQPLQTDFNRFGPDYFEVYLLVRNVSISSLPISESAQISKLIQDGTDLYNLTIDGQGTPYIHRRNSIPEPVSDRIARQRAEEERKRLDETFRVKRKQIYETFEPKLTALLPNSNFWVYFTAMFLGVLIILVILVSKIKGGALFLLSVLLAFVITPFVKRHFDRKGKESPQYQRTLRERDEALSALEKERV